jgi:hypothetical protein
MAAELVFGEPSIYHSGRYLPKDLTTEKSLLEFPDFMETVKNLRTAIPESEINPIFLNNDYQNMFLDNMKLMGIHVPEGAKLTRSDIARIYQSSYNNLVENQTGLLKGKVFDRVDSFPYKELGVSDALNFNGIFNWEGYLGKSTNNTGFIGPGLYFAEGGYPYTNWNEGGLSGKWLGNIERIPSRTHKSKYLINDVERVGMFNGVSANNMRSADAFTSYDP